jgi:hypothetical protein
MVLHKILYYTVWRHQVCFRFRKNCSYRAPTMCSVRTKAANIHGSCCDIRCGSATSVSILWLLPVSASEQHPYRSWPIVPNHRFVMSVLDALTRLRKDAFSSVGSAYPSILPSVRLEKVCSHWRNIHQFWYLKTCRKKNWNNSRMIWSLRRIVNILNKALCTCMIIFRWILLRMRNISYNSNSEHTFCFQQIFSELCAVYEIMWKNTVAPNRPWTTI